MLLPAHLTIRKVRNGRGIVALRRLRTGRLICAVDGRVVSSARVWAYWSRSPRRAANCFRFDADRYLDPHGEIGAYANHSCAPSAAIRKEHGRLVLRALRLIEPGDEVTHDYSTLLGADDVWRMRCNCGSARCRGTIAAISTLSRARIRRLRELRAIPSFILETIPATIPEANPAP